MDPKDLIKEKQKLAKKQEKMEKEISARQEQELDILRREAKDLASARRFLNNWLTLTDREVSNQGFIVSKKGDLLDAAISDIWLDYKDQLDAFRNKVYKYKAVYGQTATGTRVSKCNRQDLADACDSVISQKIEENINSLRSVMKYNGGSLDKVKEFVYLLTGTDDPKVVAIFCHWIWNIKRKVFNLPSTYHMLPVLYGKQGVGKTVILEQLLKPLQEYTLQLGVDDAIDKKQFFSYAANFVAVFDELKGASRTDVSKLKSLITANTVSARKYFTQRVCNIPQNCSFIATSNFTIGEQILDNTGMRRFYQINVRDDLPKFWSAFENIDYLEIYRSIDENLNKGYITPYWAAINQEQEKLITADAIELFLQDYEVKGEELKEITQSKLYLIYKDWCYNNGHKNLNTQWFTKKLTATGIKMVRRKESGKYITYYLVNKDSAVFIDNVEYIRR